jgi:hypothetical protein
MCKTNSNINHVEPYMDQFCEIQIIFSIIKAIKLCQKPNTAAYRVLNSYLLVLRDSFRQVCIFILNT